MSSSNWSRREFLTSITGAGAALMLSPLASWAVNEINPKVAKIVSSTMGIDTHNHIDVPLNASEMPGPDIKLAAALKRSGLTAICMTFAVDYQELRKPGDAYERFKNGLTSMDQQLAKNDMKRALNLADIQSAHNKRKPTVIQSVEGGHFLEGHLDRLQVAYDRGLRHLTLLHDHDASVPLGDVFTNPSRFGGLTSFGTDVIKECNRLGILVDMGHANVETVTAALKIAQHPVIISHTGLDTRLGNNTRMAEMMHPRLISKEQAKAVADTGGIIGVWTHLANTPLEYAENIKALVDVVGIEHVCIGTDTKLTPPYRPAGGFGPKPAEQGPPSDKERNNDHNGPPMDKPKDNKEVGQKQNHMDKTTNEEWSDMNGGFYYAVVDALLKTGFNADEIGKVGGGNFCRVFDAATKGHQ